MALASKKGGIPLKIKDIDLLYRSYMPFLKNGGLFIPTKKQFKMDQEIFIMLDLMNEIDKIPVVGRVVWITPERSQDNSQQGIGIHFNSPNEGGSAVIKERIESHLVDVDITQMTYTM